MNRRGSGASLVPTKPVITKQSSESRRKGGKDTKWASAENAVPREGDVYYRSVCSYPSHPESGERTRISVAKELEPVTPSHWEFRVQAHITPSHALSRRSADRKDDDEDFNKRHDRLAKYSYTLNNAA